MNVNGRAAHLVPGEYLLSYCTVRSAEYRVPSVARPRLLLYSKDILLLFHWLLFLSSSQNPSFSERLEQFHLLNRRGLFFSSDFLQ